MPKKQTRRPSAKQRRTLKKRHGDDKQEQIIRLEQQYITLQKLISRIRGNTDIRIKMPRINGNTAPDNERRIKFIDSLIKIVKTRLRSAGDTYVGNLNHIRENIKEADLELRKIRKIMRGDIIISRILLLTTRRQLTPIVQTQIDSLTSELISSTYHTPDTETDVGTQIYHTPDTETDVGTQIYHTLDTETDVGTQIYHTPDTEMETDVRSQPHPTLGDELSNMDNHPMFGQLYTIIDRLYGYTSCFANRALDATVYSTKQIAKLLYVIWGQGYVGKIIVIYVCSQLWKCEGLHIVFPARNLIKSLIDVMSSSKFIQYVLDVIKRDVYEGAEVAVGIVAPLIGDGLLKLFEILGLKETLGAWFKGILTDAIRENLGTMVDLFNQHIAANVAAGVASGLAAGATPDAGHIVNALVNNQDFQNMFLQQPVAASLTTSFVNGMFGALGSAFVPIATSAIGAATHQQTLTNFGGKSARKLKRKNQTKRRTLY